MGLGAQVLLFVAFAVVLGLALRGKTERTAYRVCLTLIVVVASVAVLIVPMDAHVNIHRSLWCLVVFLGLAAFEAAKVKR